LILADTSPLVFLAKLGHLSLLRDLFGEVRVPEAVWQEVLSGSPEGHPEVRVLEEAVQEGWIRVEKGPAVPAPGTLSRRLSAAEVQVLALARRRTVRVVLLDDALARRAAIGFGLRPVGTLGVLLRGVEQDLLTAGEAQACLERLPALGFRVDHELLVRVMRRLGRR